MARGCAAFVALLAACIGAEWWLLRQIHGEVVWWHPAVLGLSTTLVIGALWKIGQSLFFLTSLLPAGLGRRDGARVVMRGEIHPVGEALAAPLSGGRAVYVDYGARALGSGQSNAVVASGIALAPAVLRLPGSNIDLRGFCRPLHLAPSRLDDEAPRHLARYLLSHPAPSSSNRNAPVNHFEIEPDESGAARAERIAPELAKRVYAELAAAGEEPGSDEWVYDPVEFPPQPPGSLEQHLREGNYLFQEKVLRPGDEVTVVGRWRSRPEGIDLGKPLSGVGRLTRRTPLGLFAGDLATALVSLTIWTVAATALHLVFLPAPAEDLLLRAGVPEAIVAPTIELARGFTPRGPAVLDADDPDLMNRAGDEIDGRERIEALSAEVSGTLREINVGAVRPVDGIAWRYQAPALDPDAPGGDGGIVSLWRDPLDLGEAEGGRDRGLEERVVVLLPDRTIASQLLAPQTPCAPVHTAALLRLRGARWVRLELDAQLRPLALQLGIASGPSVTSYQVGRGPIRAKLEETDGRIEGTVRHQQWGRLRLSVPVARAAVSEIDWSSDTAMEEEVLGVVDILRRAAAARDAAATLAALRIPEAAAAALAELPSLRIDLEAYEELFPTPGGPVGLSLEPRRAMARLEGRATSGGDYVNFLHLRACDARPVLAGVAVNPQ